MPKITYQLPDGRKYFIAADFSAMVNKMNATAPITSEWPADPNPTLCGQDVGWAKNWGIMRNGIQQVNQAYRGGPDPKYVRDLEKGAAAKAEDLSAPNNYESTESLVPYQHYLGRCMSLGWGKVAVLTGTKPTTPKTRAGQATMTAAQARYMSITLYDDNLDVANTTKPFGKPISSINDEDIVTDANGHYIIVFSRPEDRPANATAANGVTWVDWGPKANSAFFMRWMSVGPEWSFDKTPDEVRLGRASDASSVTYNPNLIGKNNNAGFLGDYQPITHYMPSSQFAGLGSAPKWNLIPLWNTGL